MPLLDCDYAVRPRAHPKNYHWNQPSRPYLYLPTLRCGVSLLQEPDAGRGSQPTHDPTAVLCRNIRHTTLFFDCLSSRGCLYPDLPTTVRSSRLCLNLSSRNVVWYCEAPSTSGSAIRRRSSPWAVSKQESGSASQCIFLMDTLEPWLA